MRSVVSEAAVLYDAPSIKAKKLYIVKKFTPLEVLVSLDGMSKVREAEGSIAWIDKKQLGETRTVAVIANQAEIRQTPEANAPVLTTAEKWVALELQELPINGWARVKHRDGASGFVRSTQLWGI
jgi:SH3-like domain-containing protein